jgi:hypothetical protein
VNLPPLEDPGVLSSDQPTQTLATTATASDGSQPTTATPAPRRSILSGFFSNLGWNWTRR